MPPTEMLEQTATVAVAEEYMEEEQKVGKQTEVPAGLRVRLAKLIKQEAERLTFKGLSAEIANSHPRNRTIERRKLSSLARLEPVSLTIDELEALHFYLFQRTGLGLQGLFPEDMLEALLRRGRIALLLNTRPLPAPGRITGVSLWDLMAIEWTLKRLIQPSWRIDVELIDVPIYKTPKALTEYNYEQAFKEERWYQTIDGYEYPSVIAVGSPRTSHATEIMLARMFGQKPFCRSVDRDKLPFYFLWDELLQQVPYSTFGIDLTGSPTPRPLVNREDLAGLKLASEREPRWVDRSKNQWETYGIICVQRQPHGQLWVVLAGLTAAGTLAAAREFLLMGEAPPWAGPGKHSPVRWCVVSASVEGESLESRRLVRHNICVEPQLWEPEGLHTSAGQVKPQTVQQPASSKRQRSRATPAPALASVNAAGR